MSLIVAFLGDWAFAPVCMIVEAMPTASARCRPACAGSAVGAYIMPSLIAVPLALEVASPTPAVIAANAEMTP